MTHQQLLAILEMKTPALSMWKTSNIILQFIYIVQNYMYNIRMLQCISQNSQLVQSLKTIALFCNHGLEEAAMPCNMFRVCTLTS